MSLEAIAHIQRKQFDIDNPEDMRSVAPIKKKTCPFNEQIRGNNDPLMFSQCENQSRDLFTPTEMVGFEQKVSLLLNVCQGPRRSSRLRESPVSTCVRESVGFP